jgi:hypothetical protein
MPLPALPGERQPLLAPRCNAPSVDNPVLHCYAAARWRRRPDARLGSPGRSTGGRQRAVPLYCWCTAAVLLHGRPSARPASPGRSSGGWCSPARPLPCAQSRGRRARRPGGSAACRGSGWVRCWQQQGGGVRIQRSWLVATLCYTLATKQDCSVQRTM